MVAHSAIEQVRGTPPRSPSPPGGGTDRERRAAASGENDTTAQRKDVERRLLIKDAEKRAAAVRAYVDREKPFGEVYVKVAKCWARPRACRSS